jgi:hypothetical protein
MTVQCMQWNTPFFTGVSFYDNSVFDWSIKKQHGFRPSATESLAELKVSAFD